LCNNTSKASISLSNTDRIKKDIEQYIEYLQNIYIDENKIIQKRKLDF